MIGFQPGPVQYVGLTNAPVDPIDAGVLFDAITEDLLHDGDVDLALQKAFRWGFTDDEGNTQPGLRDIMQRLQEERQQLLENVETTESEEESGNDHETHAETDADVAPDENLDVFQFSGESESLERSLRAVESLEDLKGLDTDLMERLLTNQERSWLDQWANMHGTLADAGMVIEVGDRLELTPQAVRRIGEHVLRSIFASIREPGGGEHEMRQRGRVGTQSETSAPWQFGDPFSLNMSQTIMNSVLRQGSGGRVSLALEDFEIYERESRGSTATVLLIDMSRSMFYNGCWDAAKRSALALDTLMRGQFQRDDLEIVGFSERAERLTLTQLPSLDWNEYSHGTNLEDGLRLSREILRPFKGKTRQIVLITDGEPTAYMTNGEAQFEHPPTERVFDATMREVVRCTRENIRINTFLLDTSDAMMEFVERYSRINRGRLIYVDPSNLGNYLLRDFLQHRSSILR